MIKYRAWTGEKFIYWSEFDDPAYFWSMVRCMDLDADLFCDLKNKDGEPLDWWVGDVLESPTREVGVIIFEDGAFRLSTVEFPDTQQYPILAHGWNIDILKKIGDIYNE